MASVNIICVLSFVVFTLIRCEAYKSCKVPNGGAGTCIQIAKCQPLNDLYKKKPKTSSEHLYLQQALCSHSDNPKIKVCCPHQSEYSGFDPNPVIFPDSPLLFKRKPTPKPVPTLQSKPTSKPEVTLQPLPLSVGVANKDEELGTRQLPGLGSKPRYTKKFNLSCGVDSSSANKINGGTEAGIDEYPWLAILQYTNGHLGCGGSLIRPRFVLTAAHCVESINGRPKMVRLAEYNITSYPTDYVEMDGGGWETLNVTIINVTATFRHPLYTRSQQINDIGLVKMAQDAPLSDFIKIICLPEVNFLPEFDKRTNFTLAGWGTNNQSRQVEVKSAVTLPYMPADECGKAQEENILDTQICAGGEKYKDSCKGDSGGPLMYIKNQLVYVVGIVSYGRIQCGTEGVPAVHTNVYKYLTWIYSVVDEAVSK